MTIPTRDELIERAHDFWNANCGEAPSVHILTDFALAEIRRAVAEELEALLANYSRWPDCAFGDRAMPAIKSRLAALREQPISEASMPLAGRGLERREPGSIPGAMSAGGDAGGNSGETKARAGAGAHGAEESAIDCTAPALSDADESAWLIELSAPGAPSVWLGKCGWTSPDFAIRFAREGDARDAYALFSRVPSQHVRFTEHIWCAKLRAASAPVPVPKPVDVFEATAKRLVRVPGVGWSDEGLERVEVFLREHFGPLVAALETIERTSPPCPVLGGLGPKEMAGDALSALRRRASDASQPPEGAIRQRAQEASR